MKAWQPILLLARKSLLLLVAIVVLCIGVVAGCEYWAGKVKADLTQLQSSAQAQQDLLSTKQNDLLNMRGNIQRFEALRAQGLVGTPDRAQWVEQLESSYHAMGFAGTMTYQLLAPQPVVDAAAQAAGADTEGATILSHDLKFELRNGNEDDLLNLINSYRGAVKGRFRVQSCALGEPRDDGLNADCMLRFFSVPPPAPAAAPAN